MYLSIEKVKPLTDYKLEHTVENEEIADGVSGAPAPPLGGISA